MYYARYSLITAMQGVVKTLSFNISILDRTHFQSLDDMMTCERNKNKREAIVNKDQDGLVSVDYQ